MTMQLRILMLLFAATVFGASCGSSAPAAPSSASPPTSVPPPPAVNRAPTVTIGYVTAFSGSFELLGNVQDPEEGFLCGRQYCGSAVTSGACGGVTLNCTCLAGLEAFVLKTASAGLCTVTFTLRDSLGTEGTSSFSFDVSRPSGPASSRRR